MKNLETKDLFIRKPRIEDANLLMKTGLVIVV